MLTNARIFGRVQQSPGTFMALSMDRFGVFSISNSVAPIGIPATTILVEINGIDSALLFTDLKGIFTYTITDVMSDPAYVPVIGYGPQPIRINASTGAVTCGPYSSTLNSIIGNVMTFNTRATVPSQNLVQSPSNLSAGDWGILNATTAQSQGLAPDGTNSLNTLTDNSTNGLHFIGQSGLNPIFIFPNNSENVYTWSAYLKQGTLRYAHLSITDNGNNNLFGCIFDLQAGTVGQTNIIGAPVNTSASIVPSSILGLYLCSVTMSFSSGSQNIFPNLATSNSPTPAYSSGLPSYSGSGQSIFVWQASLTIPVDVGLGLAPPSPWLAASYNINTFHCASFSPLNVDTKLTRNPGFQWYLTGSFTFPDTPASALTFNTDGSMTISDGIVYTIAAKGTPVTNWHGTAFGGGAYFEATLSFNPADTNSVSGANGWPSWWADPVEHAAESSVFADNWQGQTNGFVHFAEMDFFEYNVWTQTDRLFCYNGTIIDWSGIFTGSTYPVSIQNSLNRKITLPPNTDFTLPHRYGFLWVPATPQSEGYFQWYFDGLPTSDRIVYGYYNPIASPAPPATGTSPWLYGVADALHPVCILESPAVGTLRVFSVDVWQASAVNNIVQ